MGWGSIESLKELFPPPTVNLKRPNDIHAMQPILSGVIKLSGWYAHQLSASVVVVAGCGRLWQARTADHTSKA